MNLHLIGLLPGTLPNMDLTQSAVELTLHTIVLWAFGRTIVNVVHSFWCEVQFDSLIVFFQCSGTYSESKISIGKAIHDTASSENYVVRSRLTPMLIVVKAVTSTFVDEGPDRSTVPATCWNSTGPRENSSQSLVSSASSCKA